MSCGTDKWRSIYQHIQNLKFLDRVAFCSRAILLTLTTLIFFPPVFNLIDTTATPTPSTTTLTLSTSDISVEIAPGNSAGTFVASDPATVSVTTNNYTGYTLGITANNNTDNTKLTNTSDNTAYFTSISSASAPADFNANNWGYLPSKLNSVANSAYQPAPTTTATTLEATTAANPTANEYTIALGAKANYTLPAGTYENTFTLTAVANPANYTIQYSKNTEDTVTNLPETQTGNTEDHSITLSNLTPSRAHYDFIGWCTVTPTTSGNTDTCTGGTTYQPGDTIDLDSTTPNVITLKAMWFKLYTCSAQYRLQNADGSYPSTYTSAGTVAIDLHNGDTCSYTSTQSATYYTNQSGQATVANQDAVISLSLPRTTYALSFSNTTYASVYSGTAGNYRWGQSIPIAATYNTGGDFSSWSATAGSFANSASASTTYTMPASTATITANGTALYLQNLASSKCTTTARYAYDSRDSDIYQIQRLADGKCWMLENLRLGSTYAITVTASNTNSSGNFTLPASTVQSNFNPDDASAWSTARINTTVKNSTSTVAGYTVKYGTYYNYCAASAGTRCIYGGSGAGSISYDICPKAWRMPTGSGGEFSTIYAVYSNNYSVFQQAFRAPLNGCMLSDNAYPRGSTGCIWSANWSDNAGSTFYLNSSSIAPADGSRYVYGQAVRCLLK